MDYNLKFSETLSALSFISDRYMIQSIEEYSNSRLKDHPIFIRENAHNAIKELHKSLKKDMIFGDKEFRKDFELHAWRLFSRLIGSIISDIECKKGKYLAYFWKNIHLSENSYIDINDALEYFDLIESITYRGLCMIKLSLEINDKWDCELLTNLSEEDSEKLLEKNNQHKLHIISIQTKKLIDMNILSVISKVAIEKPTCTDNFLFTKPTYLGKIIYDLMELDSIPDEDILNLFSCLFDIKRK